MSLREIAPVLQIALGPVILISGIGLLLLSMTNRLGRLIDRSRLLSEARHRATGEEHERVEAQIAVLSARAVYMRRAIVLAVVSLLFAAVLVLTLFLAAVLRWDAVIVVVVLFACCIVSLIASLLAFLRDVNKSLTAIRLELGGPVAR
ncbi:MAG TPA: DUF2721 domain-containing protein [Gemmatimonadales bacterium]|nr:DUF2721 domain-containing protein [Gemmatimonadales bacterium]